MPWGKIVNFAIKLILIFLDKNVQAREAREKFLEFVHHFDAHLPVKLNDEWFRQLNEVKTKIKQKEHYDKSRESMLKNYKHAYEATINDKSKL